MLQQRVLSLQILARILRRAQLREYEELVEESVMARLCEAEVPLLLRFALDEGMEAVVIAAVQALHSLLVPTTDQVQSQAVEFHQPQDIITGLCFQDLLREYRHCHCGHQLPALRPCHTPPVTTRKKKGDKEEEEEETDSDVLQRDIIEVSEP